MRRALITGIGGQDGSFLAELLLENGYEVFGIVRRAPSERHENVELIRDRIELLQGDLLDQLSLVDALQRCRPHELYNLASVSFVPVSWEQPVLTANFAAVGVTSMLEAIRQIDGTVRFYQASSSEIFGEPMESPQNEETPLQPLTPYGVAKAYGHLITRATGGATAFTRARESSTTTSRRAGQSTSCRGRLRVLRRRSASGSRAK